MIKVLFLIHDLSVGGAEKVLVNLVNNMDKKTFDITVMTLFGGGVNEQFLKPHIKLINHFNKTIRGNTHILKLFSPKTLHNYFIKETYDIEVAYLEGPCARIIGGCPDKSTKLVAWIHSTFTEETFSIGFRNKAEAINTYNNFDMVASVSDAVKMNFTKFTKYTKDAPVLYNVNESARIIEKSKEQFDDLRLDSNLKIAAVGKIVPNKGFFRLAKIHKRLRGEGYPIYTYILGTGPQQKEIESYLNKHELSNSFIFIGYQTNPYKYIANCDLFVCSSYSEGFSTAATEALIIGTPVCTTRVSGMEEMLGNNNEYGVITENEDEALYEDIRKLVSNPSLLKHYKKQAKLRGEFFKTENCVKAVEQHLLSLLKK